MEATRSHGDKVTTYKDQSTRDVYDIEEHLPVWTELPVKTGNRYKFLAGNWLQPLLQVNLEALGGEVEPSSNHGEEAESDNLNRDTGKGDVLAVVQLVYGLGIGRGCAGNHDGTDELEEQGDDIAADEDGCDPTSYEAVSGASSGMSHVTAELTGSPQQLSRPGFSGYDMEHYATKDDIDDTSHQHWCQDDQDILRNELRLRGDIVGRSNSDTVTKAFHCSLRQQINSIMTHQQVVLETSKCTYCRRR